MARNLEKVGGLGLRLPPLVWNHLIGWVSRNPEFSRNLKIPRELRTFTQTDQAVPEAIRLLDIDGFLHLWNRPAELNREGSVHLTSTPLGHIHSSVELASYKGYAIPRWHPLFDECLEEGIRELVLLLVDSFGWVTHTSCQGHEFDYEDQSLRPVQRKVGLLVRSAAEYQSIQRVFHQVKATLTRQVSLRAVSLDLVSTPTQRSGSLYNYVDVLFRPTAPDCWDQYFSEVDAVYKRSVHAFSQVLIEQHSSQSGYPYSTP